MDCHSFLQLSLLLSLLLLPSLSLSSIIVTIPSRMTIVILPTMYVFWLT